LVRHKKGREDNAVFITCRKKVASSSAFFLCKKPNTLESGTTPKHFLYAEYRYCGRVNLFTTLSISCYKMSIIIRSVADPGYPRSQIWIQTFSHPGSRVRIRTFFHPGSYIKIGMQTYFCLASYGFRSKVLVLVKKIQDPGSGKNKVHPRSGSGGKKHRLPDPQHWTYQVPTCCTL
jgi:hypothetical protein